MNTKTMRLPPRRVLTPDKRIKERDAVTGEKPPENTAVTVKPPEKFAVAKLLQPAPPQNHISPVSSNYRKSLNATANATTTTTFGAEPVDGSNQLLLAGFLSHEFLTRGTIFGEQWNPARVQAGSVRKPKLKPSHDIEPNEPKRRRYLEVANLLRADGSHLPGIVNPAQLARFLKL